MNPATQPIRRSVRLVYIMRLLDSRPYTVGDLACMCGVSRRTIYDDLAALQDEPLRYPVVSDLWSGEGVLARLDANPAL
jgi:predicted DNA-binding transcriptional regulator YafY